MVYKLVFHESGTVEHVELKGNEVLFLDENQSKSFLASNFPGGHRQTPYNITRMVQ